MTAKAGLTVWVVKELVGGAAIVLASWAYTHDVIASLAAVAAAVVSAAGGIAAAKTARENRDHRELTTDELTAIRGMLDRRVSERRGGERGTPPGEPPLGEGFVQ